MTLMVAAVDIGNKLDIPKRTIEQIETSDVLVCEYIASCKHMMHNLGIDISNKIFVEFNA